MKKFTLFALTFTVVFLAGCTSIEQKSQDQPAQTTQTSSPQATAKSAVENIEESSLTNINSTLKPLPSIGTNTDKQTQADLKELDSLMEKADKTDSTDSGLSDL